MPPAGGQGGRPRPGSREYRAAATQQSTSPKLRRALRPLLRQAPQPPVQHGTGRGQPVTAPVRHRERVNAQGHLIPNAPHKQSGALPLDHQHGLGAAGPGFGPDRVAEVRDVHRLLTGALDHTKAPSHRLSALRALRQKYGIPITQRDYMNAITPRQPVHKQSFLHKALHAVEHPVETLSRHGGDLARDQFNTGSSDSGVHEAGVFDPGKALTGLVQLSDKAATGLINLNDRGNIGPPTSQIAKNAARDVIDLPAQTLASAYLTATDPKSVLLSTLEQVKHPLKSFEQHPISTALLFRGAEGGISRLAGEANRAVGGKLASRDRLPLRLVGNATVDRKFSKGLAEQVGQRLIDRRAVSKGRGVYEPAPTGADFRGKTVWHGHTGDQSVTVTGVAGHHEGETFMKIEGSDTGVPLSQLDTHPAAGKGKLVGIQATERQLHGVSGQGGRLGRRIDVQLGKHQTLERDARDHGYSIMHHKSIKGPVSAHDLVPLINEGIVKTGSEARPRSAHTIVEDLHAELARLTDPANTDKLTPAELEDNRTNVEIVKELLASPKFLHDPQAEIAAAAHYATHHGQVENERVGYRDLEGSQARRRVLLPFAVREMGLKFNDDTKRFEDPQGRVVPDKEIISAFHEAGGDPAMLAYVPQKPGFKGAGNFRAGPMDRRPGAESKRFHGTVTAPAAYQRDYEVLAQQLARAHTRAESHRTVNSLQSQFGVTRSDGQLFTDLPQAQKEARAQEIATGEKYVPVTVSRKGAIDTFEEMNNPAPLDRTFTPAKEGDRDNIMLMPAPVLTRLWHHEIASAKVPIQRAAQSVMSRFRHVVLPTSPKWPVGNIGEMELRIGMHDPTLGLASIPRGVMLERAAGKLEGLPGENVGERLVKELRAAGGAGLFKSQRLFDVHRVPETEIGQAMLALRQAHGPKEVADAWDLYKRLVFGANEVAESGIYFSALDRFARDQVKGWSKDWFKAVTAQGDALQELAKVFIDPLGRIDQNKITAFAKMVDDMRGRYSNLSPSARWTVMTLTPFAPWYVNALYFALVTLPKTHPVKTALLAAMYQGTEKKRSQLGLTHFLEPGGAKPLPGFLQGSIPLKSGLARYQQFTPFGAFSDPVENAANLVLPQYGFLKNMAGLNFKNQSLKDAHGAEPDILLRSLIAINTAAESFVPFARQARELREGGGTSLDSSTLVKPEVKPGTRKGLGAAVQKVFNPFHGSGKALAPPDVELPEGASTNGIDWSKVDWGAGGGGHIDWSKVNWGAAK